MLIDCDACEVRGDACSGCFVTSLLGSAPQGVHLDTDEQVALGVLADAGLVPPLRLVLTPVSSTPGALRSAPTVDGAAASG